jgi:hypothetical protein
LKIFLEGFEPVKNVVENCLLTKSSGWVDVKAALWIAYRNRKKWIQ